MDNRFYKKASELCIKAYSIRKDLGTTEYLLELFDHEGQTWQGLIIPGTDELGDWLKNLDLDSIAGLKEASVEAALEIRFDAASMIDPDLPLVVIGHSKGAATALVYHKIFNADYCIAFCPARCFKNAGYLENCTIFIDPDDVVPKLGALHFKLPECEVVKLPDDHVGIKVSDHYMSHIDAYLASTIERR